MESADTHSSCSHSTYMAGTSVLTGRSNVWEAADEFVKKWELEAVCAECGENFLWWEPGREDQKDGSEPEMGTPGQRVLGEWKCVHRAWKLRIAGDGSMECGDCGEPVEL